MTPGPKPEELSVTRQLPPALRFVLGIGILMCFATLGSAIVSLFHLPLPGSVIGMVLLWAALSLNIIRLHWLESAAEDVLGILGLLFVPATVGVVNYFSAGMLWGLWILVMLSGLLLGAASAGIVAGRLIRP